MKFKSLYNRIAFTFGVLLLVFGSLYGSTQMIAFSYHQEEIIQRLNDGLARHIAGHWTRLSDAHDVADKSLEELFHMFMVANPSIDVYLLDADGYIMAHKVAREKLQLHKINLAPIRAFLSGSTAMPLKGDNPLNLAEPTVFSVVALQNKDKTIGYLYIIVAGNDYQRMLADVWKGEVFQSVLWASSLALLMMLIAGLGLFAVITRRLNALTRTVAEFEATGFTGELQLSSKLSQSQDEIGQLARAFEHMVERMTEQMRQIKRQCDLRSEMVANLSHDIRTPLASMQGYLETLLRISNTLSPDKQLRYLQAAELQSRHVLLLSQQLFELAKLECEQEKPKYTAFSVKLLAQNLMQKFELIASKQEIMLRTVYPYGLPLIWADMGMIERVLTNLMDNALRYTPKGGEITLKVVRKGAIIQIRLSDTGTGIAQEYLLGLFDRASPLRKHSKKHGGGGLGLLIAKTIIQLHGSNIIVVSEGKGVTFVFELPAVNNNQAILALSAA
ncbi:MAG: HAMP domain-containing sensor histidine kinase [Methylococcaceae bacterium]|jgi:signal transduction histidine kinase